MACVGLLLVAGWSGHTLCVGLLFVLLVTGWSGHTLISFLPYLQVAIKVIPKSKVFGWSNVSEHCEVTLAHVRDSRPSACVYRAHHSRWTYPCVHYSILVQPMYASTNQNVGTLQVCVLTRLFQCTNSCGTLPVYKSLVPVYLAGLLGLLCLLPRKHCSAVTLCSGCVCVPFTFSEYAHNCTVGS